MAFKFKLQSDQYLTKKRRRISLRRFEKGLQILPNIFTMGNVFFGFYSIIFTAQQAWIPAAFCIFFGALMDLLDGQIARWMKTDAMLGAQLDSLSDCVTFCLAPAFLVFWLQLKRLGFLGIFVCSIFLISGVLRLARFNLTQKDQLFYFVGLPTPFAACFLASLILNTQAGTFKSTYALFCLAFLVTVLSGLMISSVRIPTFKHINKGFYAIMFAIFGVFVIVFGFVRVTFLIFASVIVFALIKYIFLRFSHILTCSSSIISKDSQDSSGFHQPALHR